VSRFDDDDLEPPRWLNSGHVPGDAARTRRRTAPPRRDASSSARWAARPPQSGAPAHPTVDGEGQRPGDSGDDVWHQSFEDSLRSELETQLPRRALVSRRRAERDGSRRRRRRLFIVLAIVLLPIVLLLAAGGWFLYQLNPPGDPGRRISVTIPEDSGTDQIGDLLQDKGVIGSSTAFQIFTQITRAGPFKPGQYSMRADLGVRDAVDALRAGPAEFRLELPAGLTLGQLAERVGQLPGHSKDVFTAALQSGAARSKYQPSDVSSLEGLLFPDLYVVPKNEKDGEILSRLVTAFDQQADGAGVASANTSGLSPYQTIIVASIIEREAKLDEDRPLIAAVIRNRLLSGRPLQIDATVCYAKGGCGDKGPTASDLGIDSPYNTYKVAGLPPTPISTVSAQSLAAAARPADVPYLFYVLADNNGKHKFATTEEEHNVNVEEARQKGLL
jgi:UPF0755 protein